MTTSLILLLLAILCPIHRASAMSGFPAPQQAGAAAAQSPFAALIAEYLRRSTAGHSPTPPEIAAMATLTPTPSPTDIHEALPVLLKSLESKDAPLRTFALTTLVGLSSPASFPDARAQAAPASTGDAPVTIPTYKPEVAKVLTPSIAAVLTHLTDEAPENRHLTMLFATAFTGHAPPELYPPLFAYLKTDAAASPFGVEVTTALLTLGPVSLETSAALARFLRRPDQRDVRSDLADAIASAPNQSRDLNATLLRYLDSDDSGLRARVILSLPALDLTPDLFADTRTRIAQLAENPSENLQVVTAAKAVAPCWTAPKMPSGCPVYQ